MDNIKSDRGQEQPAENTPTTSEEVDGVREESKDQEIGSGTEPDTASEEHADPDMPDDVVTSPGQKTDEEDLSDEHDEVSSDEHEEVDEYAEHRDELPDYDHETNESLIKAAGIWAHHDDLQAARPHMEAIRTALIKRLDAERDEVKERFLAEEGNVELDFHYDQPLRTKFRDLYAEYKARRKKHRNELEAQLQVNLNLKKNLIEEIKALPESEGSAPEKYKRFRELQERWRETGHVPRSASRDLYNNYHFHVEQFYEFLKISNELRELDFKKNLEAKEVLISKAEALSKEVANHSTFEQLQALHKQWKEIGPVERELRDSTWDRFSAATKAIHDKRHEFYANLKKSHEERLQKKAEFVEQMGAMDISAIKTHKEWQSAIAKMNELRESFKALGRVPLSENDTLWERYTAINRNFNRTKNQFYKEQKAAQKVNIEKRQALIERAQELKDSTDWREASNELKALQRQWKEIGFVPRAEGDRLWKEFRGACNHFFERLKKQHAQHDEDLKEHLTIKEKLLAEVEAFKPEADDKAVEKLKSFIDQWKSIGSVPRDKTDIETQFNNLLDKHFSALKLDKKESALIRFENRVHHLSQGGDERSLEKETDILKRKYSDSLKELQQLENNMGLFFKHSDPKNPLVREAQKKIDRQKEQVALLKEKISMLRRADKESQE